LRIVIVGQMTRTAIGVAILAGYAWVVAGVKPFSSLSYVLVAIPSVVFVLAYVALGGLLPHHETVNAYYQRESGDASISTVAPWIVVLIVAVTLEVIGLSLGGRSSSVPTLSTAVDHLLRFHWERCLMCVAWLLVGVAPLIGLRRLTQSRES
jgi:hypothetical protein